MQSKRGEKAHRQAKQEGAQGMQRPRGMQREARNGDVHNWPIGWRRKVVENLAFSGNDTIMNSVSELFFRNHTITNSVRYVLGGDYFINSEFSARANLDCDWTCLLFSLASILQSRLQRETAQA